MLNLVNHWVCYAAPGSGRLGGFACLRAIYLGWVLLDVTTTAFGHSAWSWSGCLFVWLGSLFKLGCRPSARLVYPVSCNERKGKRVRSNMWLLLCCAVLCCWCFLGYCTKNGNRRQTPLLLRGLVFFGVLHCKWAIYTEWHDRSFGVIMFHMRDV